MTEEETNDLRGKKVNPKLGPDGELALMGKHGLFLLKQKGLSLIKVRITKEGEETEEVHVSDWIRVVACFADANGNNHGFQVEFMTTTGEKKRASYTVASLMSNGAQSVMSDLIDKGFRTSDLPSAHGRHDVLDYLYLSNNLAMNPLPMKRLLTQQGWADEDYRAFALGNEVIGVGALRDMYVLANEAQIPMESKGTLEEWKKCVAAPAFLSSNRFGFGICVVLAAPLLSITRVQSAGFNFFGESGDGKTTLLNIAASVYGKGSKDGVVITWNTTGNGVEGNLVKHRDQAVVIDEVGQMKDRDMEGLAYMLGNERGKERMDKDAKLRTTGTWRLLGLFSAEKSFSTFRREGIGVRGYMDGEGARIIDIVAKPKDSLCGLFQHVLGYGPGDDAWAVQSATKELADRLNLFCSTKCYGTAYRVYIEKLIEDIQEHGVEAVRSNALTTCASIVKAFTQGKEDKYIQRLAQRFALVGYAGELGIAYGVLPGVQGDALRVAEACFKDWLESEETPENQTKALVERILEYAKAYPNRFMKYKLSKWQEEKTLNDHMPMSTNSGLMGTEVLSDDGQRTVALIFLPSALTQLVKEFGYSTKIGVCKRLLKVNPKAMVYQKGDNRYLMKIPKRGDHTVFGFEAGDWVHVLQTVVLRQGDTAEAQELEKLLREGM